MGMLRLKELRIEKGVEQKQVAVELGITQRRLSSWESGTYEPDIEWLKKLANYYNVTVDYLIGRTDEFGNIIGE